MKLEHNFIVDCARDVGIRYFDMPNCLVEVQSLCEFAELIYAKGQEIMRHRLSDSTVDTLYQSISTDERTKQFSPKNWFQAGLVIGEVVHGITDKGK